MRTVGVEEELLLVNLRDGRAEPVAQDVLARCAAGAPAAAGSSAADARERAPGGLTAEFKQEQVELQTAPVVDMETLRRELCDWRGRARWAAEQLDCAVAALGTSPVPTRPAAADSPRYRVMHGEFGLVAREHLTCGCHIHVGVDDDDERVAVLDRVRIWLPVLLALSVNSPLWAGEDSGFSSYRSLVMSRWPASGPLSALGSAAAYHRLVRSLVDSGVLLDEAMVYFDARLSHRFPTVEVRVPDVCLEVEDTVLLAALARALVDTTATEWERGVPAPAMPNELLRLASWQAAHTGLEGALLHPLTARPTPAGAVVDSMVRHLEAALDANGDLARVREGLSRLVDRGTGAAIQRRLLAAGGRPVDVVRYAARLTVAG